MADNYLETKMEQHKAMASAPVSRKTVFHESLDNLVLKNRSHRAFRQDVPVSFEDFKKMISLCTRIPSARNRQNLRFRFVSGDEAEKLTPVLFFGGYAIGETGPHEGKAPAAYIVVYSLYPEGQHSGWVDVGIAAQTIALKAVEMGFNALMMQAFVPEKVTAALDNGVNPTDKVTGGELKPVFVIALGKGDEKVQLLGLSPHHQEDEYLPKTAFHYFRKDGIHYVPKLHTDDLIM